VSFGPWAATLTHGKIDAWGFVDKPSLNPLGCDALGQQTIRKILDACTQPRK